MVNVLVISKDSGIMPLFKIESGSVTCTQLQFLQLTCSRPVDR